MDSGMVLASMLGLCMGSIVNTWADRLPHGGTARLEPPLSVLRHAALVALSIVVCVQLQRAHGWSAGLVTGVAYCGILLLIAVIDLQHRLVPNVLVLGGLVLALCFNIWQPVPGLRVAALGAAAGGGAFALIALARRNAMGAGDVKLAFLIGMITGFPWVVQALGIGVVLGGAAAGLLLLARRVQPKQYIAYAPYLVAGCIVTLLYGPGVGSWLGTIIKGG
jgi:prepilin signal peptidase PulO-like enzyme (type II secretory pathway)